ncbi:MAG TPA: regulatory protein RecX [Candidatus Absconditabacterales bacterium]|nr:regulatory protein RecX [Candidatus Absconditabacterales bacterium]
MKPCIDYALEYIYRYPKSERDLRIQLIKKGYMGNEVDETMYELKKRGYIDDRHFCVMYIESELVHKGKPTALIMKKLLERGIDKNLVKELLQSYEVSAQQGMTQRIEKEIDRLKKQGDEGITIIQKLMRRGYTLKQIKETLKEREGR